MRDIRAGSIRVAGRRLRGGDPREAILAGVAHVPEDRLGTGLAPSLSVTSNVGHQDLPKPLAVARAAPPLRRMREAAARDHPALRREDSRAGDAGAQPLRRQPAEARPRAGVRGRPARPRRRPADARARRRRDRDGALVPPRRCGEGRGDPAAERGPRRDPRRSPTGSSSCTRARSSASSTPVPRRSRRSGCSWQAGARVISLERRLEQPWWLSVAVPGRIARSSRSRSWPSSSR